jgi:Trypsin-like peptidase domain
MAKTVAKRKRRDNWGRSVVRVGDGRGFVVETEQDDRLIISAGHCLPNLPPSHGASDISERTYAKLVGPLGAEPTVWVECVFVNPVDDLAVLASPDNQALWEEAEQYDALLAGTQPISIGSLTFDRERVSRLGHSFPAPPKAQSGAYMLSLEGEWISCRVTSRGRALWLDDATQPIQAGMSGSPVISPDGAAIGVVCTSASTTEDHRGMGGGPNPELAAQLPGWLLRALGYTSVALRLAADVSRTAKRSR